MPQRGFAFHGLDLNSGTFGELTEGNMMNAQTLVDIARGTPLGSDQKEKVDDWNANKQKELNSAVVSIKNAMPKDEDEVEDEEESTRSGKAKGGLSLLNPVERQQRNIGSLISKIVKNVVVSPELETKYKKAADAYDKSDKNTFLDKAVEKAEAVEEIFKKDFGLTDKQIQVLPYYAGDVDEYAEVSDLLLNMVKKEGQAGLQALTKPMDFDLFKTIHGDKFKDEKELKDFFANYLKLFQTGKDNVLRAKKQQGGLNTYGVDFNSGTLYAITKNRPVAVGAIVNSAIGQEITQEQQEFLDSPAAKAARTARIIKQTQDKIKDAKEKEERSGKAEGSLMVPPEMAIAVSVPPKDTYDNISSKEEKEESKNMLPDDEMEEEYVEFITEEILTEDEQEYLFKALDDDDRLEEILNKVMINATEFSGAGTVEGPGSGISDSIPARLSDGEFVFTKKAVDQIGADKLQEMMDEAEREYDNGRKGKALGGMASDNMYNQPEASLMGNYTMPNQQTNQQSKDIDRQMMYASKVPSLLNQ